MSQCRFKAVGRVGSVIAGAHDSSTLEFGVGLLFGVKSGVQRPRNEHRKSCHL